MTLTMQWVKAGVTLVTAGITALVVAIGSGAVSDLSTADWVQTIVIFLTGSAVVGLLDNVPGVAAGAIKAVVGAAVAGLTAWQVAYENDHLITQGEWLSILLATITALSAVYQIPDGPDSGKATTVLVDTRLNQ